jgi:hypothetical protein
MIVFAAKLWWAALLGMAAWGGQQDGAHAVAITSHASLVLQEGQSYATALVKMMQWEEVGHDEVTVEVTLPVPWTFFGTEYHKMWVCDNGWVAFEPTTSTTFNSYLLGANYGKYNYYGAAMCV